MPIAHYPGFASPAGHVDSAAERSPTSRWRFTWGFKRSTVAGSMFIKNDYSQEIATPLAGG